MSKAKLTFTLPEEQEDFQIAVNAWKYRQLTLEINEYIRRKLKYEEINEDVEKEFEDLRTFIIDFAVNESIEL